MTINQATKLEIVKDEASNRWNILVTFENGNQQLWGRLIKTERGAKARLTRYRKRLGAEVRQ